MKHTITQNPLLSIIVVIFLVILGGFLLGKTSYSPSGTTSTTSSATSSAVTGGITSSKTPTVGTAPTSVKTTSSRTSLPITVSKSVNEDEYIRQLLANQRTCELLARSQFDAHYGYLQAANFDNRYVASTGQCYMHVYGNTYEKYATSTTGHIYLRDVLRGTVLGECTSPNGGLVTDPQWSCTIKATGKNVDKIRFDDYYNELIK